MTSGPSQRTPGGWICHLYFPCMYLPSTHCYLQVYIQYVENKTVQTQRCQMKQFAVCNCLFRNSNDNIKDLQYFWVHWQFMTKQRFIKMWLKHRFELYYLPRSLYLIFFVSTKLKKFSSKLNNCTLGYHQCHLIASIKQQFHLSWIDLHWLCFSKTFPKQNTKEILIDESPICLTTKYY